MSTQSLTHVQGRSEGSLIFRVYVDLCFEKKKKSARGRGDDGVVFGSVRTVKSGKFES
jgi:hypothetical protein